MLLNNGLEVGYVVCVRRLENGAMFLAIVSGFTRHGRPKLRWFVQTKARRGDLSAAAVIDPRKMRIDRHATEEEGREFALAIVESMEKTDGR